MEPVWEYQWAFVWQGRAETTRWWMTDHEAAQWWASGEPGSRRLDETRRDRNVQVVDWRLTSAGVNKPWEKGYPHRDDAEPGKS
jgi:hypothetical protein